MDRTKLAVDASSIFACASIEQGPPDAIHDHLTHSCSHLSRRFPPEPPLASRPAMSLIFPKFHLRLGACWHKYKPLIRSKTHSRRFAPEKRGDFAEIGRRFGRNQYRDWGVGLGDFGGESPGRQTRLGRRAVGLWPQSDGRRVPASPAAHLNRGERGGPETDRRPSFG